MPKEVTHWLLARSALQQLSLPAKFSEELVFLGATFHDVLYYVRRKKYIRHYSEAADLLHGSAGEDTNHILRVAVERCIRNPDNLQLQAFLLGMVSHICADIEFHPFIYWASGVGAEPQAIYTAQRQHRALEALIDEYFCQQYGNISCTRSFSLESYYQKEKVALLEILTTIATSIVLKDWNSSGTLAKAFVRGYKNLALTRKIISNDLADTIASMAEHWLSPKLCSFTALRYSEHYKKTLHTFQNPIGYRHPVTGEHLECSLPQMFFHALERTIALFTLAQRAIETRDLTLIEEYGASLEVGLPQTPVSAMQYFSDQPLVPFNV